VGENLPVSKFLHDFTFFCDFRARFA